MSQTVTEKAKYFINSLYSIPGKVIQVLLIYHWLDFLERSDSYFYVYLVCGIFAMFAIYKSKPGKYDNRRRIFAGILSLLFSLSILLANWRLIHALNTEAMGTAAHLLLAIRYLLVFLAGFLISYHSILFTAEKLQNLTWTPVSRSKKQLAIFAVICMASFCLIDLTCLFLCDYPGLLSPDSIIQVQQCLTGNYSNHHPFWHTMIIKLCLTIGVQVFGNMSAAVALYSTVQVLAMAACFTYALTTLYQAGIPKWAAILFFVWYALMPYNIKYSYTMWKDVLFGGVTLVFTVSIYRVLKKIGNRKGNLLVLCLGGLGMCLLRSNGYLAFLLSVIVFALIFGKKQLKIILIFVGILLAAFVLKHPVLKALNVSQPDFVESLSIPIQQVSKVITDGKELTPEEKELFGKIMDVSKVPETYKNDISDPVKKLIRDHGNQDYLVAHKGEYLQAWLAIGLRYPKEYVEAWVDQTRGYWHGGYKYSIWNEVDFRYALGIESSIHSEKAASLLNTCLSSFMDSRALMPLVSVGFHFWILMLLFCCNIINRRKAETFLTIPNIAITLTLMVATPVFCEFRYAYALFTCLPFVLACSIYFLKAHTGIEGKMSEPYKNQGTDI